MLAVLDVSSCSACLLHIGSVHVCIICIICIYVKAPIYRYYVDISMCSSLHVTFSLSRGFPLRHLDLESVFVLGNVRVGPAVHPVQHELLA